MKIMYRPVSSAQANATMGEDEDELDLPAGLNEELLPCLYRNREMLPVEARASAGWDVSVLLRFDGADVPVGCDESVNGRMPGQDMPSG